MSKKKTVVVYESFYEAYKKIKSVESRDRFFQGMMEYGLNGIEPDFEDNELLEVVWTTYKPNVDANIKRYQKAVESGRKSAGNRNPKKKKEISTKVESKVPEKPIEEPSPTSEVEVKEVEETVVNDEIMATEIKNIRDFNNDDDEILKYFKNIGINLPDDKILEIGNSLKTTDSMGDINEVIELMRDKSNQIKI